MYIFNEKFDDFLYDNYHSLWLLTHKFLNVRYNYYNIKEGIKNFWFYHKVIWSDRWYDYSFLLTILHRKLEQMDNSWDNSIYLNKDNHHKQIRIAKFLCKRLIDNDYNNYQIQKQDLEMLTKILNKQLLYWWD